MRLLIFICSGFPLFALSQTMNYKKDPGGTFSLGTRTTLSAFNGHENESTGFGVGGQFRLQFANQVNSDWFFDYISSDIGDYAKRTDYHIGWSVLFYPTKNPRSIVRPYLLAGHCFDYTKIQENRNWSNSASRFSSAVQGGVGTHFNLTERLDLSLVAQYMLHLGKELDAHQHNGHVEFHSEQHTNFEGHMLFHLGINYKIADLW